MGYRWLNVDVEHDEDGSVSVYFEGRGELPFGERVQLEEGESIRAHATFEFEGQPENVEWHFDKEE